MKKKNANRVKDAIRCVEGAGYSVVKLDHLKKLEMVFKKKALATKVYLSRNEAAIYLGISAKTLANLASLKKQGKGDDPYKARKKNGRVTYCLADLRKAIGARSKKQNGADAKERKSKSKKKEAGKNRKKE